MALIKNIKDRLGNIIYPITKEKAVYDDNNIRLDDKINKIINIDIITGISLSSYVDSIDISGGQVNKLVRAYNITDYPPGQTSDNDFICKIDKVDNGWWRVFVSDVRGSGIYEYFRNYSSTPQWQKVITTIDSSWVDITNSFTWDAGLTAINKKVLYNSVTKEVDFFVQGTGNLTYNTAFQVATYPTAYYPVIELFGEIFGFTSSITPYYYESRVYRSENGLRLFVNTNTSNAQIRVHQRWVCGK